LLNEKKKNPFITIHLSVLVKSWPRECGAFFVVIFLQNLIKIHINYCWNDTFYIGWVAREKWDRWQFWRNFINSSL